MWNKNGEEAKKRVKSEVIKFAWTQSHDRLGVCMSRITNCRAPHAVRCFSHSFICVCLRRVPAFRLLPLNNKLCTLYEALTVDAGIKSIKLCPILMTTYLQMTGEIIENDTFFRLFLLFTANAQIQSHHDCAQQATFECVPEKFRGVTCNRL